MAIYKDALTGKVVEVPDGQSTLAIGPVQVLEGPPPRAGSWFRWGGAPDSGEQRRRDREMCRMNSTRNEE